MVGAVNVAVNDGLSTSYKSVTEVAGFVWTAGSGF